ncbi:VanZ family protein [Paenibacillus sp. FSL H7-0357]|nr:VanZ family protein [Paenibacillus sp. FSL H7-0357]
MDLVGFGNLIAFIPFGIFIPLIYRISFIRFITLFFLAIIVMETIQALSFLGSFDINDALLNSLGAAVGFGAYKLGFRSSNIRRNIAMIVITSISCMALLLGVWGLSGILDKALTKEEGPFVAIKELIDSSGNISTGNNINSFRISGQDITPRFNMYGVKDRNIEAFTYKYKEQMIFSFYFGMPEPSDYSGSVRVSVDGQEVLNSSGEDQRLNPELFPAMLKFLLK